MCERAPSSNGYWFVIITESAAFLPLIVKLDRSRKERWHVPTYFPPLTALKLKDGVRPMTSMRNGHPSLLVIIMILQFHFAHAGSLHRPPCNDRTICIEPPTIQPAAPGGTLPRAPFQSKCKQSINQNESLRRLTMLTRTKKGTWDCFYCNSWKWTLLMISSRVPLIACEEKRMWSRER